MKVLVTGADGFVGRHLVGRLVETGHTVTAACRPPGPSPDWLDTSHQRTIRTVPLELTDPTSIQAAVSSGHDAVIHLAAVASVREARHDPGRAWEVNAVGTARLVGALAGLKESGHADPVVLVISSGEVYGDGPARARKESDAPAPQSPYAASKLGAEIAGLEPWRRTSLRVMVARPFTHTGPSQPPGYVVPSFVSRLLAVKAGESAEVSTGNLEPVRDLLDVRDVVEAYIGLLSAGEPGEVYNVSRGEGIALRDLFQRVADVVGVKARPVPDPELVRSSDIPHLVGDASKLRRVTGWVPARALDQTLRDMVDAQAH